MNDLGHIQLDIEAKAGTDPSSTLLNVPAKSHVCIVALDGIVARLHLKI
jgi:hypothetical protein